MLSVGVAVSLLLITLSCISILRHLLSAGSATPNSTNTSKASLLSYSRNHLTAPPLPRFIALFLSLSSSTALLTFGIRCRSIARICQPHHSTTTFHVRPKPTTYSPHHITYSVCTTGFHIPGLRHWLSVVCTNSTSTTSSLLATTPDLSHYILRHHHWLFTTLSLSTPRPIGETGIGRILSGPSLHFPRVVVAVDVDGVAVVIVRCHCCGCCFYCWCLTCG